MPTTLKHTIEKLEDVSEALRDCYVERKRDGKSVWELQVDGVKTQADIDRQQAALTKERNDHAATKALLTTAQAAAGSFGELKPEEVTEKLERLALLEASATKDQRKIDEAVEQRVEARVKAKLGPVERERNTLREEVGTLKGQVSGFLKKDTDRSIDDQVREAAITAKVQPAAIGDLLMIARSNFQIDAAGKVITQDGLTPADWLHDQKTARPYLWPTSVSGGAGGNNIGNGGEPNPWTEGAWNVSEQSKLVRADATNAARLASAAGSKIGATKPTVRKAA